MPARRATDAVPPPQQPMDNSYVLGFQGFVYTTQHLDSPVTQRHPAVILLSADHAPFELSFRDTTLRTRAAMVAPLFARKLRADNVALLSFNVMPSHEAFHVFRAAQRQGVVELDRQTFSHLDAEMASVHAGRSTVSQAEILFEAVVAEARRQLPPAPAPDAQAIEVIRLLDANPHLSIEDLARQMGRPTAWMARMFASAVGMSMRDYQSWLRQRRVFDLLYTPRSLTEVAYDAGFGDSPQFSRTFLRWYGVSPSHSRDPRHVRIFVPGASNRLIASAPEHSDDADRERPRSSRE